MAFDGKEESMNHDHLREELDLDLEEMLAPAEKARLESHLASCADCRRERESLEAVHLRLAASVIQPREGFTGEVMRALVPAPWEARAVVVWRWPFAILVALAGAAAVLLGG